MKTFFFLIIFLILSVSCSTASKRLASKPQVSPLISAVVQKNCVQIPGLISQGENPNELNSVQVTPLMLAAFRGYQDCVEVLLSVKADPNLKDLDQRTAIYYALENSQLVISQRLISAGARVDLKDRWGISPLFLAAAVSDGRTLRSMLKSLADQNGLPEKPDENGWDALFMAVSRGRTDIAEELIRYGFPVDRKDSLGLSLAHLSVDNEDLKTLKMLASHQAPMNLKDHDGQTPLQLAQQKKNSKIIAYLKKHIVN